MRRAVTVSAWGAAWRAWGALVGLIAIGPPAALAQAQSGLKIACISSQQILEQTPGYTAAESTFKKEYQGYQEEVQKLRQQLDSAAQAFEKQSIALSSAAKQTKQRDLQQMQQRL